MCDMVWYLFCEKQWWKRAWTVFCFAARMSGIHQQTVKSSKLTFVATSTRAAFEWQKGHELSFSWEMRLWGWRGWNQSGWFTACGQIRAPPPGCTVGLKKFALCFKQSGRRDSRCCFLLFRAHAQGTRIGHNWAGKTSFKHFLIATPPAPHPHPQILQLQFFFWRS